MNPKNMKLAKVFSILIFVIFFPTFAMAGWAIGTDLGYSNPKISNFGTLSDARLEAAAEAGIQGTLLGLSMGCLSSFGGLGLITAWGWRKQYPKLRFKHALMLILGWLLIPAIFCSAILLLHFFPLWKFI